VNEDIKGVVAAIKEFGFVGWGAIGTAVAILIVYKLPEFFKIWLEHCRERTRILGDLQTAQRRLDVEIEEKRRKMERASARRGQP